MASTSASKAEILRVMPYKQPFLFVDSVLEAGRGKVVALKGFRAGEWFFRGHFKDFPIVPGTIILEALGQAAVFYIKKLPANADKEVLAYKVRKAEFPKPTFPGETMRLEVELKEATPFFWGPGKPRLWSAKGRAKCGSELRAKAEMHLAVLDRERFRKKYR